MLRRIVERTVRLNSGWKSRAHAPCPHHQRQRGFMSEAGAATFSIVAKRTMLIVPTAGLGAYALTSEDVKRFGFSVGVLPVRLGRDVYCATRMFVGRLIRLLLCCIGYMLGWLFQTYGA